MYLLILLIVCVAQTRALVIRVPQDVPNIQTALNTIQNRDTILISVGNYAEALVAPPLSFLMKGDVTVDSSGVYPRPTIDPSSLPDSVRRGCLFLPNGSHPIIEDIRFHNEQGIQNRTDQGGIRNFSTNPILRRCVFDSVYNAFIRGHRDSLSIVTMESCRFINDTSACVALGNGALRATDCIFSGTGSELLSFSNNSFLLRCQIRDNNQGKLLNVYGTNIEFRDCTFGPRGAHAFNAIDASHFKGRFIGNIFTDIHLVNSLVINLASDCSNGAVEISGNTFIRNRVDAGSGCIGVLTYCQDFLEGFAANIHDNIFIDCVGSLNAKALDLRDTVRVFHNSFTNILPLAVPTVDCSHSGVVVHENAFFGTGKALRNTQQGIEIDAINNWWGHETGPYHATLNPFGEGDTVIGDVLLDPWYTDTLFFTEANEPRTLIPREIKLEAYPNPFNSSIRLVINGFTGREFRLTLHNLLGQEIAEIAHGPITGGQIVYNTPASLGSGVYFVRASDGQLAQTKKIVFLK